MYRASSPGPAPASSFTGSARSLVFLPRGRLLGSGATSPSTSAPDPGWGRQLRGRGERAVGAFRVTRVGPGPRKPRSSRTPSGRSRGSTPAAAGSSARLSPSTGCSAAAGGSDGNRGTPAPAPAEEAGGRRGAGGWSRGSPGGRSRPLRPRPLQPAAGRVQVRPRAHGAAPPAPKPPARPGAPREGVPRPEVTRRGVTRPRVGPPRGRKVSKSGRGASPSPPAGPRPALGHPRPSPSPAAASPSREAPRGCPLRSPSAPPPSVRDTHSGSLPRGLPRVPGGAGSRGRGTRVPRRLRGRGGGRGQGAARAPAAAGRAVSAAPTPPRAQSARPQPSPRERPLHAPAPPPPAFPTPLRPQCAGPAAPARMPWARERGQPPAFCFLHTLQLGRGRGRREPGGPRDPAGRGRGGGSARRARRGEGGGACARARVRAGGRGAGLRRAAAAVGRPRRGRSGR